MRLSADRVTFDHYAVLLREDGTLWELGRGAMGVTYKAEDVNLRCPVALKVISVDRFSDEKLRQRFVGEARAAARVRHPNVASVHHLGSDGEYFFYSMEIVEGESAEALVQRTGPLPARAALQITLQVARALSAAAREHLVHRDIKPANLMIVARSTEEEEELTVKVIDFGLARYAVRESGATSFTRGGFVGTPQFASPEQAEELELDGRSDIYSLGCTLWYLLAGHPPFRGSVARVFSQHLHSAPPIEELCGIPSPAVRLLERMLRKDPAQRPQNAVELRRELEHCLAVLGRHEALATRLALPVARLQRWRRAHSRSLAAGVAGLAAIAVLSVLMRTALSPHPGVNLASSADSFTTALPERELKPTLDSPSPEILPSEPAPIAEGPSSEATLESALLEADEKWEISSSPLTSIPVAPSGEQFGAVPDEPEIASADPPRNSGSETASILPPEHTLPVGPPPGRPPPDDRSAYAKLTDDARQFVRTYLSAAEKSQPTQEIALYADQVDYFSQGRLSRKAIEADQRNYYRRWPKRSFELLGEPQIVEIKPTEVVVRFRMRYQVRNTSQATHGITENTVRLKRNASEMRITAIRERKLEG